MIDNFCIIKLSDTMFTFGTSETQLVFTVIDFCGKLLIVDFMLTLNNINIMFGHISLETIVIQSLTIMNNQKGTI